MMFPLCPLVFVRQQAGSRPGGRPTFFASPKKVGKERRAGLVGPARCAGQAALLGWGGVWLNSPAAQTTPALIRPNLRYSPPRYGTNQTAGDKTSKLRPRVARTCRAQRWHVFPPSLLYAPRSAGISGSGLALFERSEFSQTPLSPSTAGCPGAQRRGRRQ